MRDREEKIDNELASIEKMYAILDQLAIHFSIKYECSILREHIFDALFIRLTDKYTLEWQGELWHIDISYEDALSLLDDFDFNILQINLISEQDILPDELRLEYKVRIKSMGLVWIIHKYDKDPFPSNPHAHQLENNIKLDLSNGKCYKIRKHVHTIHKKDLLEIREKAEKVFSGELPTLEV